MTPDAITDMLEALLAGQFPSKPGDRFVLTRVPGGLLIVARDGSHVLITVRSATVS